jgi:hypothetical protein
MDESDDHASESSGTFDLGVTFELESDLYQTDPANIYPEMSELVQSLEKQLHEEKNLRITVEKELAEVKSVLEKERKELQSMRSKQYQRTKTDSEKRGSYNKSEVNKQFKSAVVSSVEEVTEQYPRMGRARMGKLLAQAFWTILGCIAQTHLIYLCKNWLKSNVFSPWMILRAMDLAGGRLSYAGLEVLRSLEHMNRKYWKFCILPSRASLQRVAVQVQLFGQMKCPFQHVMMEGTGEGIEFDHKKTLAAILEACGLSEIAKQRCIMLAGTVDGSDLSKHLGFIMGGLKINDFSAINPITKRPIYAEDGDPRKNTVQSRNMDFVLALYMGRETKKTFGYFTPMFQFLNDCADPDKYMDNLPEGFQPLRICINCDLSAAWKGLMSGGAAKKCLLPCHCCDVLSESLHKPNEKTCSRWCRELHHEDETWQCYHKDMLTEEKVQELNEELSSLHSTLLERMEAVERSSKMRTSDNFDEATPKTQKAKHSVHFVPTNDTERQEYNQLLTRELILRNYPVITVVEMEMRREALRDMLREEKNVRNLLKKIEHAKPDENASFLLMQTVPCCLHCSNRSNLKVMTVLLQEGLSNAKSGDILSDVTSVGRRIDKFFSLVNNIVNYEMLGDDNAPGQWNCPTNGASKNDDTEIGIICMINDKTVKVLNGLEALIDLCIKDDPDSSELRKEKWMRCIPYFREAMKKLGQKEDFTDDDIKHFQYNIDKFFQDWVDLNGLAGITNYIHMLASGHFSDYLFKWRNLYAHSQQGWEHLNNLVKTFHYRRTGRGGATNGGKGKKSKVLPIGRWLQRRLIWMLGTPWEEIRDYKPTQEQRNEIPTNPDDLDDYIGFGDEI